MAKKETAKNANPDFDLDQLFSDIENRARKLIENINKWVGQSEELIDRSRTWLDEHPVAAGVATKYGRKLSVVPSDLSEARQSARMAGQGIRRTVSGGYSSARTHPMETALIAAAAGIAGYAIVRLVR